jgi:hypothetical protein
MAVLRLLIGWDQPCLRRGSARRCTPPGQHPRAGRLARLLLSPLLAACDIDVQTHTTAPDTGLPAYPGARLSTEDGKAESAHVRVDMPFVDVEVAAASFTTDDTPADVAAF